MFHVILVGAMEMKNSSFGSPVGRRCWGKSHYYLLISDVDGRHATCDTSGVVLCVLEF